MDKYDLLRQYIHEELSKAYNKEDLLNYMTEFYFTDEYEQLENKKLWECAQMIRKNILYSEDDFDDSYRND